MKFDWEFEKPTLDSVVHIALASVVVGYFLVSMFPSLQAMIA